LWGRDLTRRSDRGLGEATIAKVMGRNMVRFLPAALPKN